MFCRAMLLLSAVLMGSAAHAEAPGPEQNPGVTPEEFEASLEFLQGHVALPNGIATLEVPDGFRYLGPADSRRMIEQVWGNPSGEGTLGMLFPTDVSPLSPDAWGIVITYEEDGHISDEDADDIRYDELLKEMQESTRAGNEERVRQGFPAMTLAGWATEPFYDKVAKKLYWAQELQVAGSSENTLNYHVRILGRQGVLVLNAVAAISQLPVIRREMGDVLAFTNFTPGNAYGDFDPGSDKVAAYGLAALVAGGLAAKAGLFAKLIPLLIAGKKFILIGAVALFGVFAKLLNRKGKGAPPKTD